MVRIKNWKKEEYLLQVSSGKLMEQWVHTKSSFYIYIRKYPAGYSTTIANANDGKEIMHNNHKRAYNFAINFMKCHTENPVLRG